MRQQHYIKISYEKIGSEEPNISFVFCCTFFFQGIVCCKYFFYFGLWCNSLWQIQNIDSLTSYASRYFLIRYLREGSGAVWTFHDSSDHLNTEFRGYGGKKLFQLLTSKFLIFVLPPKLRTIKDNVAVHSADCRGLLQHLSNNFSLLSF